MKKRILVVDDDRSMVSTLCDICELHGWEAIGAYDGGEAAALVVEHEIDVVLMDVRMERVDGVEGLRRIKASRPGTRVILMTAYAAQELLAQAETEGALHILKKPVAPAEILALLEEAASLERALLVVDHDAEYLRTLCDALQLHGFETVQASTLGDALRTLEERRPPAVLLHLRLEHVEPERALVAIREVSATVLVILYSGLAADLSRTASGRAAGLIDAAFTKPLEIDRLVEFLNAASS